MRVMAGAGGTVTKRGPALAASVQAEAAPSDATARAQARLEAHFETLTEADLLRVAQAVELARACEPGHPTDEQILTTLRPRLRRLRPGRIPTFQRAVCCCLEPYLRDDLTGGGERRRAVVSRTALAPWWRLMQESPQQAVLQSMERAYRKAMRQQRGEDAQRAVDQGIRVAAAATVELLEQAEQSPLQRQALIGRLGGRAMLQDLQEIAVLQAAHPQLTPALDLVRRAAGVDGGRIAEFSPPVVAAARMAYLNLHDPDGTLTDYFFYGLLGLLGQPWQALRLVRALSLDLSQAGQQRERLIPARLFSDLAQTLGDLGRVAASAGTQSRRIWLLTSARLLDDAGRMIRGLAEESGDDAELGNLLLAARSCVSQALDGFAAAGLRDCLRILPVRPMVGDSGKSWFEPDMTHRPTEDEVATALAATALFGSVRRLAEQEGLARILRPKEADLEEGLRIAVNFRIDYLRARLKHGIALAQLEAVLQVLRTLPALTIIRDLEQRVERTLERYR